MKTLKILFVVFFLVGIFQIPASAQPNKIIKGSVDLDIELANPCNGEWLSGTITINYNEKYFISNNNRVGVITEHNTITGTIENESGTVYTVKERYNVHGMGSNSSNTGNMNGSATSWMLLDGKKYARINIGIHRTVVNGEVKREYNVIDVKCF